MINDVIRTLSFLQPRADDDFVDQLHYYYTTTFLIILAVLVSFKMFAGRPMECWIPAEYPKHWGDFAEMYCWAQNTYYVPIDEDLADNRDPNTHGQISYYQWVPFFLLFQAMFFYMPCLIWRFFNVRSGVIMQDILALARDTQNIHPEIRSRNVEALAVHLESVFDHRFKLSTEAKSSSSSAANGYGLCRYCNMRYYDGYMTTLYMVIKILYLINVTGQLFLMNAFLQTSSSAQDAAYTFYGAGVFVDLLKGRPWQNSGYFPRVTMCDMHIRTLANIQKHSVQCVLVLNIFNEKIFILLWLLYTILMACTVLNLLFWIFESFSLDARSRFLLRHLELAGLGYACTYKKRKETASVDPNASIGKRILRKLSRDFGTAPDKAKASSPNDWNCDAAKRRMDKNFQPFARDFVKLDGAFVLRMLTAHAGVMFTAELVEALWQLYDDRNLNRDTDDCDTASVLVNASALGLAACASSPLEQVDEVEEMESLDEEIENEDEDTGGRKEGGVKFLLQQQEPSNSRIQPRSSLMTLSARQSMQQRRLSVKRSANRRRSISASQPQSPSYV